MQNDPIFLCHNARRFFEGAHGDNDARLYFLAISIELSLKAYLRHQGWTDSEAKRLFGHNIIKASTAAQSRGLELPDIGGRGILATISLYYVRGGFRRCRSVEWPQSLVLEVASYALDLNERVRQCVV